jgi:hypothetical protein
MEIEYEGEIFSIKTKPFTVGDLMDWSAYTDYISYLAQKSLPEQVPVSSSSRDLYTKLARALVIIQKGLSGPTGDSLVNVVAMVNFMRKYPDFVKFINDQYDANCEPLLVKSEEDAKKK